MTEFAPVSITLDNPDAVRAVASALVTFVGRSGELFAQGIIPEQFQEIGLTYAVETGSVLEADVIPVLRAIDPEMGASVEHVLEVATAQLAPYLMAALLQAMGGEMFVAGEDDDHDGHTIVIDSTDLDAELAAFLEGK